jgi:hypothetical protein
MQNLGYLKVWQAGCAVELSQIPWPEESGYGINDEQFVNHFLFAQSLAQTCFGC